MSTSVPNEQALLNVLRQVPQERWKHVLDVHQSFHSGPHPPNAVRPVICGADLVGSDLIGIWKDHADLGDSREFARQLRHRAEHRRDLNDASGH